MMKMVISLFRKERLLFLFFCLLSTSSFSQYCNNYHKDYCPFPDFSYYYDKKQSDDYSMMIGDSITIVIKVEENKDYYISARAEGVGNTLHLRLVDNNPARTLIFDNASDLSIDNMKFTSFEKKNVSLTVTLQSIKKKGGKIYCMGVLIASRTTSEKPKPIEEPIAETTPVLTETIQPIAETTSTYQDTYQPIVETTPNYQDTYQAIEEEPAPVTTYTYEETPVASYTTTIDAGTSYSENEPTPDMSGVVFYVQVAAVVAPLTPEQKARIYSGSEELVEKVEGIWYKYQIVIGSDYETAKRFKLSCGVKGAFIVPYRNGKKINIKEVIY